ncbi:MAG: hypothetical protein E6I71_14595 [Chloroflexi bacterium]|nr:MAG: hypothetical protein E6I71_14595 [Chloroflexota bacterium]
MVDMPSVELLTAFAKAPNGKKATGYTYQELLDVMRVDCDEAIARLKSLLNDARTSVRAWACIAGAEACGRKFVPTLCEAFNDRSQDVQEMVVSGLLEIDPSGQLLRPLLIQLRRRLLVWDGEGAPRIARLLAIVNDTEAVPYFEQYLERSDINVVERARGGDYLLYLREGIEGILGRIRNHRDHAEMAGFCRIAFFVGSPDAEPALEQLHATAPDERCRVLASQTLDALKAARTAGPPPYWDRRFDFKGVPRLSSGV